MKMFTAKEEKNLSDLLARVSDDESCFDLEELHGMLFGLAVTPEVIPPEEWLPIIFTAEPDFDDEQDATTSIGHLMDAYNRMMHESNTGKLRFPFNYKKMTELDFSLIPGWTYGFFMILSLRPEIWGMTEEYQDMPDEKIPEKLRDIIGACFIITGIAFPEEMDAIAQDLEKDEEETLEDIEDELYLMLPTAVNIILKYGETLRREMLSCGIYPASGPKPEEKVGRNDACPCGSGKKYKKCCGAN